jgi:hypothetical protein
MLSDGEEEWEVMGSDGRRRDGSEGKGWERREKMGRDREERDGKRQRGRGLEEGTRRMGWDGVKWYKNRLVWYKKRKDMMRE